MGQLPRGLIDSIVDECADEKADLLHCSLVASPWLPRARQHLFHTAVVWLRNRRTPARYPNAATVTQIEEFSLILGKLSPELRGLIKCLRIWRRQDWNSREAPAVPNRYLHAKSIQGILRLLPNLIELDLRGVTVRDEPSVDPNMVLTHLGHNLCCLTMKNRSTSECQSLGILNLLLLFASIKDLQYEELGRCDPYEPDEAQGQCYGTLAPISSLKLTLRQPCLPLIARLQLAARVKPMDTLELRFGREQDILNAGAFLRSTGTNLRTLKLDWVSLILECWSDDYDNPWVPQHYWQVLKVSSCPILENLVIIWSMWDTNPSAWAPSFFRAVPEFLYTTYLSSPTEQALSVHTITIHISLTQMTTLLLLQELQTIEWNRMKTVLEGMIRHCGTKCIRLKFIDERLEAKSLERKVDDEYDMAQTDDGAMAYPIDLHDLPPDMDMDFDDEEGTDDEDDEMDMDEDNMGEDDDDDQGNADGEDREEDVQTAKLADLTEAELRQTLINYLKARLGALDGTLDIVYLPY
ncbi:unnamed protein product [Somion occarium]|uniref:F-box domain-containing protein n=1 Tax=Somion occarium TaxID=3059160 RepID=A0ABP1D0C7_9APHY